MNAVPKAVTARKPAAKAKASSKVGASVPVSAGKAEKKLVKPEKVKLTRDSFTMPKSEYLQFDQLKARALKLGLEVKKSELIRAGLSMLVNSADAAFKATVASVPKLKKGRPATP